MCGSQIQRTIHMQIPSVGKKKSRTTKILQLIKLGCGYETIYLMKSHFRATKSGPADSWPSTDEDEDDYDNDDDELDLDPKVFISA